MGRSVPYPAKYEIKKFSCPVCKAPRGWDCRGKMGRRRKAFHWERVVNAATHLGIEMPTEGMTRRQRHSNMVVRYECPICGEPHSKADHPKTILRAKAKLAVRGA